MSPIGISVWVRSLTSTCKTRVRRPRSVALVMFSTMLTLLAPGVATAAVGRSVTTPAAVTTGDAPLPKRAEKLKTVQMAAAAGSAMAQFKLSIRYSKGLGVQKDHAKAVLWAHKSAEQGNAYGQAMLGMLYLRQGGPAADFGRAVKWLQKSAEQGNRTGEALLGLLYEVGKGVPQDVTRAAYWYLKSAKQGDMEAAGRLGYLYAHGTGVKKDCRLARYWFSKAASEGDLSAQTVLQTFGKRGHVCYTPPV